MKDSWLNNAVWKSDTYWQCCLPRYQQPKEQPQLFLVSIEQPTWASGEVLPVFVKEKMIEANGISSSKVATVPNLGGEVSIRRKLQ